MYTHPINSKQYGSITVYKSLKYAHLYYGYKGILFFKISFCNHYYAFQRNKYDLESDDKNNPFKRCVN